MYELFGNPEDRFTRDEAHIHTNLVPISQPKFMRYLAHMKSDGILPLLVGVLCWSLFWYALLNVHPSIIFTRKREMVALLLLSFGCLVTVNVL